MGGFPVGEAVGDVGDVVGAVGARVGDVDGTWVGEAVGALVGSMWHHPKSPFSSVAP